VIPYLDAANFTRRSPMPVADVAIVQKSRPGYLETLLRDVQELFEDRLRKRYGRSIPFGQAQPPLTSAGTPTSGSTSPPVVTLTGVPTCGANELALKFTTGGAPGVAAGQWSQDGGVTWTPFTTAAPVVLGSTGITASFGAGTYSTDNVYAAPPPVPGTILRWMVDVVTPRVYDARGVNGQDPTLMRLEEKALTSAKQLEEAANSETGLFDLPTNNTTDSAITTGGPSGYTEESPYVFTDVQRRDARQEDEAGVGTGFDS
jgi:hypothetical protein